MNISHGSQTKSGQNSLYRLITEGKTGHLLVSNNDNAFLDEQQSEDAAAAIFIVIGRMVESYAALHMQN